MVKGIIALLLVLPTITMYRIACFVSIVQFLVVSCFGVKIQKPVDVLYHLRSLVLLSSQVHRTITILKFVLNEFHSFFFFFKDIGWNSIRLIGLKGTVSVFSNFHELKFVCDKLHLEIRYAQRLIRMLVLVLMARPALFWHLFSFDGINRGNNRDNIYHNALLSSEQNFVSGGDFIRFRIASEKNEQRMPFEFMLCLLPSLHIQYDRAPSLGPK